MVQLRAQYRQLEHRPTKLIVRFAFQEYKLGIVRSSSKWSQGCGSWLSLEKDPLRKSGTIPGYIYPPWSSFSSRIRIACMMRIWVGLHGHPTLSSHTFLAKAMWSLFCSLLFKGIRFPSTWGSLILAAVLWKYLRSNCHYANYSKFFWASGNSSWWSHYTRRA